MIYRVLVVGTVIANSLSVYLVLMFLWLVVLLGMVIEIPIWPFMQDYEKKNACRVMVKEFFPFRKDYLLYIYEDTIQRIKENRPKGF
jgi:hypothetical protein